MTEQSEQDFREIERVRDLPPDEPYGDREADYWDAEEDEDDDEPCIRCGLPFTATANRYADADGYPLHRECVRGTD